MPPSVRLSAIMMILRRKEEVNEADRTAGDDVTEVRNDQVVPDM